VKATCTAKQPQQQQEDAGAITQEMPAPAKPAGPQGGLDPTLACCLGAAPQPGAPYDVSRSGPPLPGCEAERCVQLTGLQCSSSHVVTVEQQTVTAAAMRLEVTSPNCKMSTSTTPDVLMSYELVAPASLAGVSLCIPVVVCHCCLPKAAEWQHQQGGYRFHHWKFTSARHFL
jgi:hypothetical protein